MASSIPACSSSPAVVMVKSNREKVWVRNVGRPVTVGKLVLGILLGTGSVGENDGDGLGAGLSVGVTDGMNDVLGRLVLVGPGVGTGLGAGDAVGVPVGTTLSVGTTRVGSFVGDGEGIGLSVGPCVGGSLTDGWMVRVGFNDGDGDGACVSVGDTEGPFEGAIGGVVDGVEDGMLLGTLVDGVPEGTMDGNEEGTPVTIDGVPDGRFVTANSGDASSNGCSVGMAGARVGKRLANCGAAVGAVCRRAQPHPAAAASSGSVAHRVGFTNPSRPAISRLPQVSGN